MQCQTSRNQYQSTEKEVLFNIRLVTKIHDCSFSNKYKFIPRNSKNYDKKSTNLTFTPVLLLPLSTAFIFAAG
jgi:hypothetical protein